MMYAYVWIANFKETDLFKVFQTGDLGNYYNTQSKAASGGEAQSSFKQQPQPQPPRKGTKGKKKGTKDGKTGPEESSPTMPQLLALLKAIYSIKFRENIRFELLSLSCLCLLNL